MGKYKNIYLDKKKEQYYFSISLGKDSNGKRIQKLRRGFDTAIEAKEAMEKFLQNYEKEGENSKEKITFNAFVDDVFLPYYKNTIREQTYTIKVRSHLPRIKRFFGNKNLQEITKLDVLQFQQELANSVKLMNSSINVLVYFLKLILDYACNFGYLKENVARPVSKLRVKKKEVKIWTLSEFTKFVNVISEEELKLCMFKTGITLLFMSGLRIGELFALKWENIDFENKILKVQASVNFNVGKGRVADYTVSETKSEASRRKIAINTKTIEILKKWQIRQRETQVKEEFIFKISNTFYSLAWWHYQLKKFSKIAEVKRIKIHSLRHSHVAFLINKGINALQIQKRLGHSDVTITLSKYGHLYANYEDEIIKLLENIS